jgi:hypothetical protein
MPFAFLDAKAKTQGNIPIIKTMKRIKICQILMPPKIDSFLN